MLSHSYRHLESKYRGRPYEVELSVDETDSPTTPFGHFLVANELKRLGVKLVSLAPRFVVDFEKGVDFKGDLALFQKEYIKHVKIAGALGPYKISIHSGSDKFSVYQTVGALKVGRVHVKTAGTSYLEALRTIAAREPDLFGEILDFARSRYETDKASYHISAKLDHVPSAQACTPERFLRLFDDDDARQVLHVTFGSVLTCKDSAGKPVFKDRILQALETHEEVHYDFSGRSIVITGGTGVLGREMACALGGCRANVAIISRKPAAAEQLVKRIEAGGGRALVVHGDVCQADTLKNGWPFTWRKNTRRTFASMPLLQDFS